MNKCQSAVNPSYEHVSCPILMEDICPQEAGTHPVLTFCAFFLISVLEDGQDVSGLTSGCHFTGWH